MNNNVIFLILAFTAMVHSSELCINDYGIITKIDNIDIDGKKVGMIKYENNLSDDEKEIIEKLINEKYPIDSGNQYKITLSKVINECIVLGCYKTNVSDGGIYVVYSRVSKMILGRFNGSARGGK
jgi:hypothetical protein